MWIQCVRTQGSECVRVLFLEDDSQVCTGWTSTHKTTFHVVYS